MHTKHMFDRKKTDDNHFCGVTCSHVNLPIFRNFDTSK